jgi:hypothetical protein
MCENEMSRLFELSYVVGRKKADNTLIDLEFYKELQEKAK